MHHHPTLDEVHAEVLDLSLALSANNAVLHGLTLICADLREQLIATGNWQDQDSPPPMPRQGRLRRISA